MSTTANAVLLPVPGRGLVPLDMDPQTQLLPTFQCNDRTKPESIQSDYSPEFEVPGTAHNHALLRHAAASQPTQGQAYARLPAVLTSGGVEVLPLALLYIKGYQEGKYQLQLAGGNKRFVEALQKPDGTDKMLADLQFDRFNHLWTPANVLNGLPYTHWANLGWGYEVLDRGRPLDWQAVDPYSLYPSVSFRLVWEQLLQDAGFTADELMGEPLFAALNVPAPVPYTFSQDFRDKRALKAGYTFPASNTVATYYKHDSEFTWERLRFTFVGRKPYTSPDATTGATYADGRYTVGTLGLYDLQASVSTFLEINDLSLGHIRCEFQLRINGQVPGYDGYGSYGHDVQETGSTITHTFTPKLTAVLLAPGDTVELWWQGKEINLPSATHWRIGATGSRTLLADDLILANEVQFTVVMREQFPAGGLVQLGDWLPQMKQLDFFKSAMLLLGLTVQCDDYESHLHLAPGNRLLSPAHVAKAPDWTRKRDAYAPPGRLPERQLAYRFGSYGQTNTLAWEQDEHVTEGYGNGTILIADQVLATSYELAKLPFVASEPSPDVAGLLRILNYEAQDFTANPVVYNNVTAKPRLVLRRADGPQSGQLVLVPEYTDGQGAHHPAQLAAFTTTVSYFAGVGLSLELNGTVLGTYWQDLRAMLDQSRYLTERYRLTPADIAALDYSVPIWDGLLGDYFAVSQVSEYDARRAVEVKLVRLNSRYLPPPVVPGGLAEWYEEEWFAGEWY